MPVLSLTYDNDLTGTLPDQPSPAPWAPPCMKIRADAIIAGDVIGLYPLPLTRATVTREWRADDGLVITDQGAWDAGPSVPITLLAVSR